MSCREPIVDSGGHTQYSVPQPPPLPPHLIKSEPDVTDLDDCMPSNFAGVVDDVTGLFNCLPQTAPILHDWLYCLQV